MKSKHELTMGLEASPQGYDLDGRPARPEQKVLDALS